MIPVSPDCFSRSSANKQLPRGRQIAPQVAWNQLIRVTKTIATDINATPSHLCLQLLIGSTLSKVIARLGNERESEPRDHPSGDI
jgi:hypothetical protein